MSYMRKFLKRVAMLATIFGLIVWQFPTGQPTVTYAGAMSGVSAIASSTTKSASADYTIKFTPATTSSQWVHLSINFQSPPDAQFNINSVSLGSGGSSAFTEISQTNPQWGNIGINANGLTAGTEYTLVLSSITNPSKDGKYNISIETWGGFDQRVDSGSTSITIGTIAIEGSVKLPDSTGARGAYVEAQDKTNFGNRYGSPTADDGSYGIGGLTAGTTYILNVWLSGGDPNSNTKGYVQPDSVEIIYAGSTITQNFTLKTASKTVTGKLQRANGAGIAGGRVMANRMDSPGWTNTETDSSGNYTLLFSGGKWEIRPDTWAGPGQTPPDYTYSGPGIPVKFAKDDTIETKAGVNLTVINASSTITGTINPIITNGGIGVHNRSGFGTGTGVDPQTGAFSVKVPAGTYELDMFTDPMQSGDKYTTPDMDPITVGENATKNLGVINLVKMDKSIIATVKDKNSGTGIAGFEVFCFQPNGGGFGMGRTGGDGKATIMVKTGEWGCMAQSGFGEKGMGGEGPKAMLDKYIGAVQKAFAEGPPPQDGGQKKYVVMGGPKFVKISSSTPANIDFNALEANRTISVIITDVNGNPLQEHGFIEAELISSDLGGGFDAGGLGQPIDPNMPGMAAINVPAGKYNLRMMTPPGSDYSSGDPTEVDVTNGNASATIKLLQNDSTVSGVLKDEDGLTVTGIMAFVTATNKKGAFIPGDVNSSNGSYSMRVPSAGGELSLGYFVDPTTGYFEQPITDNKFTPVAGQTAIRDIVMKKATTTVNFTVKDGNGNAVANAFVEADNRKSDRMTKMDNFFNHGEQTGSDGKVTLRLPAGDYSFTAFLPPETLRGNKWLPPKSEKITLVKGDTKDVTLQFQKADIELKGKVTKNGTAVEGALVTAFSENGEAINAETNSNGDYSFNVISGQWHIGARNDEGTDNYISTDKTFDTTTTSSITENIAIEKNAKGLSSQVVSTFDTDNSKQVSLSDGAFDGAYISIPQDALDTDSQGGNASISLGSTVEVPNSLLDKPLGGIALQISAQDSNGQSITSTNSSVAITMPIDKTYFTNAGLTVDDIGKKATMSYYDEENGKWSPLEGSVTAVESGSQILVTGQSSHFTSFAVTAATDTTSPSAPTSITATSGNAKVTLAWTNPTTTDFTGIKIYRSTTAGTVGDLITTIAATTTTSYENTGLTNGAKYYYVVRSYDSSGNISTNTTQVSATPSATATLPATGMAYTNILDIIKTSVLKLTHGF